MMTLEHILKLEFPFAAIPDTDNGGWAIVFPDLPGCIGWAKTWDTIGTDAREASRIWLTGAFEDGDPIPEPSTDWEPVTRKPEDFGRSSVLNAHEVAEALGISRRRVSALSQARGIGTKVGTVTLFTADDIERLRPGAPGRPAATTEE